MVRPSIIAWSSGWGRTAAWGLGRAKQGSGARVGDQLGEAGGVFKSPSVGGAGVVVHDGDMLDAALAGVEFSEPDAGQLRVEEHGVRDQAAGQV